MPRSPFRNRSTSTGGAIGEKTKFSLGSKPGLRTVRPPDMTHNNENPGALAGATGALNVIAGAVDCPEDSKSPRSRQAARLTRLHPLTTSQARLVAGLAFGEARP